MEIGEEKVNSEETTAPAKGEAAINDEADAPQADAQSATPVTPEQPSTESNAKTGMDAPDVQAEPKQPDGNTETRATSETPAPTETPAPMETPAPTETRAAAETRAIMAESGDDSESGKKSRLPFIIGGIIVCAAAVAGGYAYKAQEYKTKFLPNTTINGINVSDSSADSFERLLDSEAISYQITVKGKDAGDEIITGEEMGAKVELDGISAEQIIASQNIYSWITAENSYTADEVLKFDEAMLDKAVEHLNMCSPDYYIVPVDATVAYDAANGYIVTPETDGNQPDIDKVKEIVREAVGSRASEADISADTEAYYYAGVRSDDPALNELALRLNTYAGAAVSFNDGDNAIDMRPETINSWIVTDESGNTAVSRDAVTDYVQALAAGIDNLPETYTFMTSYGREVEIDEGTYGTELNQKQMVKDIMNAFKEGGDHRGLELPYIIKAQGGEGEPLWGKTYIEVNLTTQHMSYFVDGVLTLESDVVSGLPNRERNTPEGVYYLYLKDTNRILRGTITNGVPQYESFVNYWMPFKGGYGLHDATWRGRFGGNIYRSNGSHGCVNLPYKVAKELYPLTYVGLPVIVYYLDDSTMDDYTVALGQPAAHIVGEPETDESAESEETEGESAAGDENAESESAAETAAAETKAANAAASAPATVPATAPATVAPAPETTAQTTETQPTTSATQEAAPETTQAVTENAGGDAASETEAATESSGGDAAETGGQEDIQGNTEAEAGTSETTAPYAVYRIVEEAGPGLESDGGGDAGNGAAGDTGADSGSNAGEAAGTEETQAEASGEN